MATCVLNEGTALRRTGAMTQQSARTEEANIDAELDRIIYSVYLLTLDPGLALSVALV
jgi:hypothetical protein